MRHPTALLASILLCAASHALAGEPEIRLEGTGEARAKLDAMSFKPFDAALLGKLTDWTGGDALTPEALSGKVVMFVTFSSWYKTSHDALRTAQSLHAKFAEKGLIVVGVHHKEGFPKAADLAKAQSVEFRYALDKTGEFRKSLGSTQDPDFYFVDRAGRLRFADVETSSVEAAAQMLVDETAEKAAAAAPSAKPADAAKAEAPAGDAAPTPAAAGNYKQPAADAYKAAKWPKFNPAGELAAKDFQGKPLPKPLGKEKYLDKAPDRAGKVTVIDFWATWCGPCRMAMPKLDDLQKKHKADLVVIGISDEPESKVKTFLKQNPHSYPQAIDQTRAINNGLQIQGIPHVVILSSDGTIRWQGNPLEEDFPKVVADVIAADPGVAARRTAAN
jgi:thiol-disulfide isomerase/thioredoxin